jgi:hypothetical protein
VCLGVVGLRRLLESLGKLSESLGGISMHQLGTGPNKTRGDRNVQGQIEKNQTFDIQTSSVS